MLLTLLAAVSATADVIHLKNGRTIWADQVREDKNGHRIQYDIGDDTYAIPTSSVERVEAGGVAPIRASAGANSVPDLTQAAPTFDHQGEIEQKVIRGGKVDIDAVKELERAGNSEQAAIGYFLAGKNESDQGNFPRAKSYYDLALSLQPNNATLLIYYAACLLRTGQTAQALPYAERAVA